MQLKESGIEIESEKYIIEKTNSVFFEFNNKICCFDIDKKKFYYISSNTYKEYEKLNIILKSIDFTTDIYGNETFVGFNFNDTPCLYFNGNIYIIDFNKMTYDIVNIEENINHSNDYDLQAINCFYDTVYYTSDTNIISLNLTTKEKNIIPIADIIFNFFVYDNILYYFKKYNDIVYMVKVNLENGITNSVFNMSSYVIDFDDIITCKPKDNNGVMYCASYNSRNLLKIDIQNNKIVIASELEDTFANNNILVVNGMLYLVKKIENCFELYSYSIYEQGFLFTLKECDNTYIQSDGERIVLQENEGNKYKEYVDNNDNSVSYILKTNNLLVSNSEEKIELDVSSSYNDGKWEPVLEYEYNGIKVYSLSGGMGVANNCIAINYKKAVEIKYTVQDIIGCYNEYLYYIPYGFSSCSSTSGYYFSTISKIQRINILTQNIEDVSTTKYLTYSKLEGETTSDVNWWYCDRNGYSYFVDAMKEDKLKEVGAINATGSTFYKDKVTEDCNLLLCLDMKNGVIYEGSQFCEDGNSLLKGLVNKHTYSSYSSYYEFSKNSSSENYFCMYENKMYYMDSNSKKTKLYLYEFDMSNFTKDLKPTCKVYDVKFDGSICLTDVSIFDNYYDCETNEENFIICIEDITYIGKRYGRLKKEGDTFVFKSS